MITLRYPYYMSALPLAEVMPVLLKEDLLWMAGIFGMKVPKSKKKEASTKWDDLFVDNQPYAEDDGLWMHYKEDMMKRKNDRDL